MPMISILSGAKDNLNNHEELLENIGMRLHEDLKTWGKSFRLNIEQQMEPDVRMIDAEGNSGPFIGVLVKVLLAERNDGDFIEKLINSLKTSVAEVMKIAESDVTIIVQKIEKGCFLIKNKII